MFESDIEQHILFDPDESAERRHVCNFCDKRFKKKNHAREHLVTHMESRPYSCTICDKGFRRLDYYWKHFGLSKICEEKKRELVEIG